MFSKLADVTAIRNFGIVRHENNDEKLFNEFASGDLPARASGQTLNLNEQTREETIRLVRQIFFSGHSRPQAVVLSMAAGVPGYAHALPICWRPMWTVWFVWSTLISGRLLYTAISKSKRPRAS